MNARTLLTHAAVQRPHSHRRRGVTLVEVSVSILLVASLGSLIAESIVSRARQQRTIDLRELAVAEAANLMERLTAFPWNDLAQEKLARLTFADDLQRSIPAATVSVSVEPSADQPEAKRISIKIEYPGPGGQAVRPVRLTSWVYRIDSNPATPKAEAP